MYEYMGTFTEEHETKLENSHPAAVVPHFLAGSNRETTAMRVKQLEQWFQDYVEKRNSPHLYKPTRGFVPASIDIMTIVELDDVSWESYLFKKFNLGPDKSSIMDSHEYNQSNQGQ